MSHKRTKHIAVKYHYSKEQQDIGTISISYISSEDCWNRMARMGWIGMEWLEWIGLLYFELNY
jgi:hypothetical protein